MVEMRLDGYMPVKIISGRDCVQKNSAVFSAAGKRAFLVTGGSAAKSSGALADIEQTLDGLHIEYAHFDRIGQNPATGDCYSAGTEAHDFGADFIIGIGGGSPLDAAKAVAIYAANGEMTAESIYNRTIPAKRLPLFLVGTTAGTGSEVTGVSVLTNAAGYKKSISGADCYAVASFCDAKYTESVPYSVTVSTALDAYAHALESFLASTQNDLSSLYSMRALPLLWREMQQLAAMPAVLPTRTQRESLYIASLYAGLAINITGTAFPHTVGYILTESFAIPHGRACTAFHPLLLEKAEKYCPERLEAVCKLLHADKESINNLVGSLTDVCVSLSEEEAHAYCSRWTTAVKNFDRTPGGFTPEQAEEALMLLKK